MSIPFPQIDPVAFRIGPLAVRWYGIMYLLGYAVGAMLAKWRGRRGLWTLDDAAVDSLIGYLVVGMLVGARVVYVLVYDWPTYRAEPIRIPRAVGGRSLRFTAPRSAWRSRARSLPGGDEFRGSW